MGYHIETHEHVKKARKTIDSGDYSKLVPFMDEPEPSPSRRTGPEIAYRRMAEAIEGLEPRELRELSRVIKFWKRCDAHNRWIIEMCALEIQLEQQKEDEAKEAKRQRSKLVLVRD